MRLLSAALVGLSVLASGGAVGQERTAFAAGTPWKKDPIVSKVGAPLSIYDPQGMAKPAGTVRDWLIGHDQSKNDCEVTETVRDKQMWIVCTRRGLYGDPPHKLVFAYQASVFAAGSVLINFATADGNPLVGRDLIDHFRDEIQD
ncbi:hypothetical protein [Bosea sp. BK604]|uniref:hypothetical protein n=1 Tax=Bosea sp. BK604 TaxID=2512180 RepID=UPI001046C21F|nr:hypothetical protein [Bosea sp. BK604]TCR60936.1 hypothetical protein EV560_115161 [Bosea sp. BK604]